MHSAGEPKREEERKQSQEVAAGGTPEDYIGDWREGEAVLAQRAAPGGEVVYQTSFWQRGPTSDD